MFEELMRRYVLDQISFYRILHRKGRCKYSVLLVKVCACLRKQSIITDKFGILHFCSPMLIRIDT